MIEQEKKLNVIGALSYCKTHANGGGLHDGAERGKANPDGGSEV